MEGTPVEDGETGFANETIDHLLGRRGLRARLPPCPPWPDLN